MGDPVLAVLLKAELLRDRKLDKGNPNLGNIKQDFNRLGVDIAAELRTIHRLNGVRLRYLEDLNGWRNAIAHQDFARPLSPVPPLHLSRVRQWRRSISYVATSLDDIMASYIFRAFGYHPW